MSNREIWDNPETRKKWAEDFLWDREEMITREYEDLPYIVKLLLKTHPRRGVTVKEKTIQERIWAPGDTYLVVPDTQVMAINGFKKGDRVRITIEQIEE